MPVQKSLENYWMHHVWDINQNVKNTDILEIVHYTNKKECG